jgi:Flp pilus assembly protein CpaB
LTSIDDAVGKIARTNLFCNQPILSNMLAENARDVPDTIPPLNATFDCTGGLPAAFEFTEVVIAVQNLTRGQAIPPNAVALRPFPSGLLPGMAYTSLEDVVGSIAPYDIYREQAITEQMLIQIPDASIPTGKVVVAVPLDRAVLVYGQQTIIDVYAPEIGELLEGTPVAPVISADGSYVAPTRMTRVADNAQIVGGENTLLVVAVSPEEATLLRRLIETDFPLTLVDAGLIEQSLASNPDMSDEVPEGMVAVSVPRSLILAVPHGLLSDHVDIVATLRFVDVDEDSQQPVTTSTPATTSVAQQVISNALQIPSDDPNVMTLVVSPEDAVVLTWLVEARIPLILVSPGSWPGDPILVPANP